MLINRVGFFITVNFEEKNCLLTSNNDTFLIYNIYASIELPKEWIKSWFWNIFNTTIFSDWKIKNMTAECQITNHFFPFTNPSKQTELTHQQNPHRQIPFLARSFRFIFLFYFSISFDIQEDVMIIIPIFSVVQRKYLSWCWFSAHRLSKFHCRLVDWIRIFPFSLIFSLKRISTISWFSSSEHLWVLIIRLNQIIKVKPTTIFPCIVITWYVYCPSAALWFNQQ